MIEVENKKEFLEKFPYAYWKGEEIAWDNYIALNFIGATCYLDTEVIRRLSIEELEELKNLLG